MARVYAPYLITVKQSEKEVYRSGIGWGRLEAEDKCEKQRLRTQRLDWLTDTSLSYHCPLGTCEKLGGGGVGADSAVTL